MVNLKKSSHPQIEVIKESILDGHLSHAQIQWILNAEIDKELNKPAEEVDMEYVNACGGLLEGINRSEAAQVESHMEENYVAIQAKLHRSATRDNRHIRFHPLLAAACLLVVLFVGDAVLTAVRVNTSVTPDEQQLIIEGAIVSPNTINRAEAGSAQIETQKLSTADWRETVSFLGFEPAAPTWVPDGWEFLMYENHVLSGITTFSAIYSNEESDYVLHYDMTKYDNIQKMRDVFEQEKTGTVMTADDNRLIYIVDNINTTLAIWIDGQTIFTVAGPVSKDDLMTIVNSIQ